MPLQHTFIDYTLDDITRVKEEKLADGWRAMQILCTNCDDGIEIVYSYTKDDKMENYVVHGVTKDDVVPSITDAFIGMFVFENEAHDLFGVNIQGIAIDFGGKFYDLATPEPMTVISAEKQAAREKAAKVAAAKAAAEAKRAQAGEAKPAAPSIEEQRAAFEAKIADLDPEKAAKMRAAFEAKLAKQAAEVPTAPAKPSIEEQRAAFEAKIANVDPEKAAKMRAAFEAKLAKQAKEGE